MRELDELEVIVERIEPRLSDDDREQIRDMVRFTRIATDLLEEKYLEVLRDREVIHSLLIKTSEDLLHKYRAIFEYAGTAMVVLDRNGTISLANSYFEKMVGIPRSDIEEKKKFSEFADSRLDVMVGTFMSHEGCDDQNLPRSGEGRLTGIDNTHFEVFVRMGWFPGSGQCVLSIIDITTQKRAEEELVNNRKYLSQIFSSLQAGIIVIDAENHEIMDVNATAASMIGLEPHEIVGKVCHRYICPAEMGRCPITDLHQTIDNAERVLINTNGVQVPIIKYAVPVTLHGHTCLLETFIDNSERKRAEEALRQANRKLDLLGSITRHDINNKFMAIRGYLDLAARKSKDPRITDYLKKMGSVTDTIQSQIAFTRIYKDLGTSEPQWQDLGTILNRLEVPETITMAVDPQAVLVFADLLLEKVFYNLLDNSIRHGERVTDISVSYRPKGDSLVIIWEDNGVGIPVDEKEKIFEHGYGKNTGLGMFLVREILSLTRMTIRETGIEGNGARFEIHVPKGAYRYGSTV